MAETNWKGASGDAFYEQCWIMKIVQAKQRKIRITFHEMSVSWGMFIHDVEIYLETLPGPLELLKVIKKNPYFISIRIRSQKGPT